MFTANWSSLRHLHQTRSNPYFGTLLVSTSPHDRAPYFVQSQLSIDGAIEKPRSSRSTFYPFSKYEQRMRGQGAVDKTRAKSEPKVENGRSFARQLHDPDRRFPRCMDGEQQRYLKANSTTKTGGCNYWRTIARFVYRGIFWREYFIRGDIVSHRE
jgi:hypothetical protein